MVICLERDADLHTAQLMPLPLTLRWGGAAGNTKLLTVTCSTWLSMVDGHDCPDRSSDCSLLQRCCSSTARHRCFDLPSQHWPEPHGDPATSVPATPAAIDPLPPPPPPFDCSTLSASVRQLYFWPCSSSHQPTNSAGDKYQQLQMDPRDGIAL